MAEAQEVETQEVNLADFNEPAQKTTEPVNQTVPPAAQSAQEGTQNQAAQNPAPAEQPAQQTTQTQPQPAVQEDAYAALDTITAEGVKVDADTLKSFKEIAKANNLSVDAAKAIVELQVKSAKKQADDFKALQDSWANASKVVYGDNLENVKTNCSRVLAELDKDGKFKELLALAGAEQHPATLAFLKNIGDKLLEKPVVNPSAAADASEEEVDLENFN